VDLKWPVGGLWRLGARSGALWRSLAAYTRALCSMALALSGGPTPRSAALSGGLVPSIHHVFIFSDVVRSGSGKESTFPIRNVF